MRLLEVRPKGVGSGCLTTGWTSRSLSSSLSPARETRSRESWSVRVRVCTFHAGACVCLRAPAVRARPGVHVLVHKGRAVCSTFEILGTV